MTRRFLVDANVLSEATRADPDDRVLAWLSDSEPNLVVDAVVLGELRAGVQDLPAGRKRAELERWLEEIATSIQCLPWDCGVGRRWAQLVATLRRKGRPMPIIDSMIAATALHHGLVVATRNVGDFRNAGVETVDPSSR